VAGVDFKDGAVALPPTRRIRPHWWAVLAVSVSLLALVAATSDHPNTSTGTAAVSSPPTRHQIGSTTPAPAATTTTPTATTEPAPGPAVVTAPTSPSTLTAGSAIGARVVVRQATTPASTTTTTTVVTAATATGGASAAAVQTVPTIERSGDLQQPDDASNSYQFAGSGPMEVTASVVIPDADGPCDVVLKETVVQYVAVPYILTIGPEGG
jgi:hypothetical protein